MPNKIEALPSRSITTIYIVAVISILLGLVWSYCNLFVNRLPILTRDRLPILTLLSDEFGR